MLSKDVFNKGIGKLVIEYKGFEMTKDRSLQWYEFMKSMSDNEFTKKINSCLKGCNHVPYMSDVINAKPDEIENRPNAAAYREYMYDPL